MAYNMSIVEVFAKKSHFSKLIVKNASLTLPYFTCRANWDSELKTKTIPRLVPTPKIQC